MQVLPNGSLASPTHGAIPPFRLFRPHTIDEALEARAAEPNAFFHAGGIDTVRRLRDGAAVSRVIDLNAIADLSEIRAARDRLVIGATVTHARIESDAKVMSACPSLAAAWRTIGNVRVRWTGTVGGNVMTEDPLYDGIVLLTALDAEFEFAGPSGIGRQRPAATASWQRPADELLTRVVIANPGSRRVVFDRSMKPLLSLAVGADALAGEIRARRIVVGCAFAAPICIAVDAGYPGKHTDDVLARLPTPIEDAYGSASYRRRMIGVLLSRVLARIAAMG